MTKIRVKCPRCERPCDAFVSQRILRGKLAWSAAMRCSEHNDNVEIDGAGLLPPDLRARVLEKEGTYALVVERDAEPVHTLRQIQMALGLPLSVLTLLKKNMPGPVLSGTKFELNWLRGILHSKDTIISVVPISLVPKSFSSDDRSTPDLAAIVSAE